MSYPWVPLGRPMGYAWATNGQSTECHSAFTGYLWVDYGRTTHGLSMGPRENLMGDPWSTTWSSGVTALIPFYV